MENDDLSQLPSAIKPIRVLHVWQEDAVTVQAEQRAFEQPRLATLQNPGSTPKTQAEIQAGLLTLLAELLHLDPQALDISRPFSYYGFDSVDAIRTMGKLETWLGRSLSPTLIWDYPNIEMLAHYLAGKPLEFHPATATAPQTEREPIAIIGLGCRFPGAQNPEEFWRLLHEGGDAITEVPANRWDVNAFYDPDPAAPGKTYSRAGGFLPQIDQFDPTFFGITPREATRMDPQQRLLLEVAWEALENAGLAPERLAGSPTGVFIGISGNDYWQLQFAAPHLIDAYTGTGNEHSIAANRLSYLLGLHGPSLAIDTACSSSLVAVHLACESLRRDECHLALAGGVNLILTPFPTIVFSQARMMARDGHCKTFDARADGYVRSEGCGVVLLKRLSSALEDGDPILAVVRGTAVNHDGSTNGLAAPNGLAQQEVIRQALADAAVSPDQISYVEAHGTGTLLGDPIEVQALQAVLSQDRALAQRCAFGSVKTNIGHLEAAAGIAGLIKVVLSLQHEEIPPHLHLTTLNPHIPLEGTPFFIPLERLSWPAGAGLRLAGVSSFGFGGTNAHAILQEGMPFIKPAKAETIVERPLQILTLSAKSEVALKELAQRFERHLAILPAQLLADLCFTANTGRSHFPHRLAVVAGSQPQARRQLESLRGNPCAGIVSGLVPGRNRPGVVFLFTGQGAQYTGMARQLYETQPTFHRTLDRCAELLRPQLDRPLLPLLFAESDASLLNETVYTQPALFAVEYALAELWRSWGVAPEAVLGHSVGEYVAACVAGAFSLEDGLYLIAERGRLMQTLPPLGMMAAVFAEEARIAEALLPYQEQVSIAAINGPRNIVISGIRAAVQDVMARFESQGIMTRQLVTSQAFHSALMEPVLDAIEQTAGLLPEQPLRLPLISNVTGERLVAGTVLKADYWRRHTRQPVRFAGGINELVKQGRTLFLEVGPRSTLAELGKHCVPKGLGTWLPSLQKDVPDWQVLLQSLSTLWVQGVAIDWLGFDRDYTRCRVAAPTYPFQRQRYWFEAADSHVYQKVPAPARRELQHEPARIPTAIRTPAPLSKPDGVAKKPDDYENLVSYYRTLSTERVEHEEYLTFAPFLEIVPGFSWLLALNDPRQYSEQTALGQSKHQEMRTVLFRGLDLGACKRVLDIGCGYASDLIRLAKQYPHLELDGCNISPEQLAIGRAKVESAGLQDRLHLFQLDSARQEFPNQYDLAIGFQVIHHIQNKQGVISNVSRHLRNGGLMVLAEIVSNLTTPIEHPQSSAYFVPKEEWAELLAQQHLRIVECVDASREIANFLYDPDFEKNLERLTSWPDAVTRSHLEGPHLLGELLRKNLAVYFLFTVQKDDYLTCVTLWRANREKLSLPLPYSHVRWDGDAPLLLSPIRQAEELKPQGTLTLEVLQAAAAEQRPTLVEAYLQEQIALVSGLTLAQVDRQQPLNTLGLDSLMILELKKRNEENLQVSIAVTDFFEGLTITQLAARVLNQMLRAESLIDSLPQNMGPEEAQRHLEQLNQLADEQVDRLLAGLLAERDLNQ